MAKELSFTSVVESAAKLPLVKIDREEFLTKNLGKFCTPYQLQKTIVDGTLQAGIPLATLDTVANAVINAESLKVTAISAAAGIPGGLAMAATVPVDLAQFYGFVIRLAQENTAIRQYVINTNPYTDIADAYRTIFTSHFLESWVK